MHPKHQRPLDKSHPPLSPPLTAGQPDRYWGCMSWLMLLLVPLVWAPLLFVVATGALARVAADKPPSRGLDTVRWALREWAVSVIIGPLLLTGTGRAAPPAPSPGVSRQDDVGKGIPVLLLHGYDMNRASMAPLAAYLRARGWRWVHAVNHGPQRNPIAAHARRLGTTIADLKAHTGAGQVDVVAHSMGGLVAAYYAARMNGASDIRHIVTLGTPWRGTRLAHLGWKAEARDLEPNSEVVADVAEICEQVPVTSIWTPGDQIVIPATHSVLPGARMVELPLMGHLDMLFDGRVFTEVRDALKAPPAPA